MRRVLAQGWACGRITQGRKIQREGLGACDGSEIIFRDKTQLYRKEYNGLPGPSRLSREVTGSRSESAAGSVNRTEHRLFRLTPAFSLRSLRKNGYVALLAVRLASPGRKSQLTDCRWIHTMASHADVKEPEVINESLIRACLTTADYLPIPNEKIEVRGLVLNIVILSNDLYRKCEENWDFTTLSHYRFHSKIYLK